MRRRSRIWLLCLMVVVGIAPMISVLLAGLIAELNGCSLHEGFIQPCIVFGTDIGGVLYTMGVMGWLMLASIFLAAGGLLGLAYEAVLLIVQRLWPR